MGPRGARTNLYKCRGFESDDLERNMTPISVVLCTHNPREDYLRRVLAALDRQTLPKDQWELLLIDNASSQPLEKKYDLSWHPNYRHVCEEHLGLTPARLRGIAEAKGSLLVFVDDDNVLAPDYLKVCLEIISRMPWLGAFGGSTVGEYEVPLPPWASRMPIQLAVREIKKAAWGCVPGSKSLAFAPVGAGMAIRQEVAGHYLHKVHKDKLRQSLDRKGDALTSGGDSDMAFCACELGYAVGVFPELSLVHVMPKERLEAPYLLKLAEGTSFSHAILRFMWDNELPPEPEAAVECRSLRMFKAYERFRSRLRGRRQPTFAEQWNAVTQRGLLRAREFILSP